MKMIVTPVVTSFLTHSGKVLFLKRSEQVGTYRGAWAGISGFAERLPLEQACVEIEEEVGLSRDDIRLRGIGIPLSVKDNTLSRIWQVFPFLFEIDDPSRIRIDWETEEAVWAEPGALADMTTVPGLKEALASVWPAFGDSVLWNLFAQVATDTSRGATLLAMECAQAVESYLERVPESDYRRVMRALAACRPSMAVFPHMACRLLLEDITPGDLARELADATAHSATHAAEQLGNCNKVLTISYSSAVRSALQMRAKLGHKLEVVVMESRPCMEGVTLARELAADGVDVTVITDAQAGIFASMVDAVVVGCDAITVDDQVQNKVGTDLLTASAALQDIPCFAVAQSFKAMPPDYPYVIEEQEPDNVGKESGIRFRNIIFDTTPLERFSAVYTENGALISSDLSNIRTRLGAANILRT